MLAIAAWMRRRACGTMETAVEPPPAVSPLEPTSMAQPPSPEHDARLSGTPSRAAVKRAMSWVGAGHVVGQAFWFGSLLFLAALLSPRAIGSVTVGLLMVTAATRLMDAGTRGSIIVAPTLTRQHIMTALASNVGAGLVMSALIALLSGPMTRTFAHGTDPLVLAALGLSVLLYAPAIAPLALLEKRLEFRRRAGVQLGATITAGIVSVIAGLLGAGVWALVLRQSLYQAMLALLGWIAARRPAPRGGASARRGPLEPPQATWRGELHAFQPHGFRRLQRGLPGRRALHEHDATRSLLAGVHHRLRADDAVLGADWERSVSCVGCVRSRHDPSADDRRRPHYVRGAASAHPGRDSPCADRGPRRPRRQVGRHGHPAAHPARGRHRPCHRERDRRVALRHREHRIPRAREPRVDGGHAGALIVLVQADGIRGAAFAHLLLYAPVAIIYGFVGLRLLGAEPRRLGRALRGVAALTAVQAGATFVMLSVLLETGVPRAVAGPLAVAVGLAGWAAVLASPKGRTALLAS